MVVPVHEHTTSAGASRLARLGVLGALGAATGYVFLADPDKGGAYPLCPSRVVLGLDCPLCGGLRGTNALLHGRIAEALDHNLLLPLWLGFAATILGLWLLRPGRTFRPPRWVVVAGITLLAGFAVVRNLPFDSLDYLASGA